MALEPHAESLDRHADAFGFESKRSEVVLSIDAMSGDFGPEVVVDALSRVARDPTIHGRDVRFMLHGDARALKALLADRSDLARLCELRHCDSVVPMDARPREALRAGKHSSMWRALEAVAEREADVAISAGNTAALMTMASLRLRALPDVSRPAIAALWPSRNPAGSNVVLDLGADLAADARALTEFAVMGAEYARIALAVEHPRVALLNVGAEPTKGRPEHRDAADALARAWRGDPDDRAAFVGFVEGDGVPSDRVDVVVTDGFTGNVALKSAEGTARLIADLMRETFGRSIWTKIGALAATPALRMLKRRIDPRQVNGGVFLGLDGLVVKSHGGADAVAFAAAVTLGARISGWDLTRRIGVETARMSRFSALRPEDERDRPPHIQDFATGAG